MPRNLCLLIAALMISGCATSEPPLTLPTRPAARPPLDSRLAEPCPPVPYPEADDYDAWQAWAVGLVGVYADCRARHGAAVEAWSR